MMDRIQKVKTIVREWLLEHSEVLVAQGVQMEMVADNKDYLRIILETTDRMGEIVVEDAGFAPYRFFKFEVAQIVDEYREALKNGVDTYWRIEGKKDEEETSNHRDSSVVRCRSCCVEQSRVACQYNLCDSKR